MIKNVLIAILISTIHSMWIGSFSFLAFISLAAVLFFAVWAIEDSINNFKRKLVFKRRIQKKIAEIKISPKPTKAS